MEVKSPKYQLLKDSDEVSIEIVKENSSRIGPFGYFCLSLWGIGYLLWILIWLSGTLQLVILCSRVCVRQVFYNRIDGEGFFPGLVLLIITTVFVLTAIIVIRPMIKLIFKVFRN